MKRFTTTLLGLIAGCYVAAAGITPLYENNGPMLAPPQTPPQVDALAFVNRSQFQVNFGISSLLGSTIITSSGTAFSTAILDSLYDFTHTLYFTNSGGGVMSADPGFRFDQVTETVTNRIGYAVTNFTVITVTNSFTNTVRVPAANFDNQGQITVGLVMLVNATNIQNSGFLNTSAGGVIHLAGENLDLERSGLRSGQAATSGGIFVGNGVTYASNYFNDAGVSDVYWGAGTNNALNNQGMPFSLPGNSFNVPFPSSPPHEVLFAGSTFTNTVTVPGFGFFGTNFNFNRFDAFAYTNQLDPTTRVVQVVFVPTNSLDTNFSTEVRFAPDGRDAGQTAIVEFKAVDFDIVDQRFTTNYVYFLDGTAFETNVFLANNSQLGTRRPNTYAVTRNTPFDWLTATPGNAIFSPDLLYNPNFQSNTVQMIYAAYEAAIGSVTTTSTSALNSGGFIFGSGVGDFVPGQGDPTNQPGRIQIVGGTVNLNKARVRAESLFSVIATNDLVGTKLPLIDAPFVNLDLASQAPVLRLQDVVPDSVNRLGGSLAAWTGIWNNNEMDATGGTTNVVNVRFHVLIVDSQLTSKQQVVINEFAARAAEVEVGDSLLVGSKFRLDTPNVHIADSLTLPSGSDWAFTNVQNVVNFTNDGVLALPSGVGYFGWNPLDSSDSTYSYDSFINRGTISGAAALIASTRFENAGGTIQTSGGVIAVRAVDAVLTGGELQSVTNIFTNGIPPFFTNSFTNVTMAAAPGILAANSDVRISAENLDADNTIITTGTPGTSFTSPTSGALVLDIVNRLSDSASTVGNFWGVTAGFKLLRKPNTGDLLGTIIESRANTPFQQALHLWAAEDRGANPSGYTNNAAVGQLTLTGTNSTLFSFSGTGVSNALYVDYLALENNATNFSDAIEIAPNLVIYFADASVPAEKLDGKANGHLRWVSSFVGPFSSTNILYPNGRFYTFNRAIVASNDLDSDGDGIVNSQDPTPIDVGGDISLTSTALTIDRGTGGGSVNTLSWIAMANCRYVLEGKDTLAQESWSVITNFVNNASTRRVTLQDPEAPSAMRLYRLRIEQSAQ